MLEDKRELIKIAHYYYKDGLTQQEIAQKLSISRQKVNRSIKRLHEEGIVKIEIMKLEDSFEELESALERKFNLQRVIVAHADSKEDITRQLGVAGAEFLMSQLSDNVKIGVSWGKTLHEVGANLRNGQKENIEVIQLVGGVNSTIAADMTNEITRQFASSIGGIPHYIYAPAIVKSRELKDSILQEDSIRVVMEKIDHCDMAFVGIGELSSVSTIYEQKYLDSDYLTYLQSNNAVGDICLHVFDKAGNFIEENVEHFSIGLNKEQLLNIPNVVAIAGGKEKVNAIIGALRTGAVDVLITDSITADMISSKM